MAPCTSKMGSCVSGRSEDFYFFFFFSCHGLKFSLLAFTIVYPLCDNVPGSPGLYFSYEILTEWDSLDLLYHITSGRPIQIILDQGYWYSVQSSKYHILRPNAWTSITPRPFFLECEFHWHYLVLDTSCGHYISLLPGSCIFSKSLAGLLEVNSEPVILH
jgi:hypothetical protein